jgi:FixJ family two-component response regulator
MPGMNGTELARRIRITRPELPVILVTGYADLPNGLDPSLPRLNKPYRQQELGDLITTLAADQRRKVMSLVREPAAE